MSAQQAVPHVRVGQAALHVLAEQVWGDGQAAAHDPQLAASVFRSTHTPLQRVNPAAHVGTHVPEEQVSPAGHTMPQVPQFLGSVDVLVQIGEGVPGQLVLGDRHWHTDAEQTWPEMQTIPQPPQLEALVEVSTQVPVAGSLGQRATGEVLHTHAAAWQVPGRRRGRRSRSGRRRSACSRTGRRRRAWRPGRGRCPRCRSHPRCRCCCTPHSGGHRSGDRHRRFHRQSVRLGRSCRTTSTRPRRWRRAPPRPTSTVPRNS
jgi:hypothetical protein